MFYCVQYILNFDRRVTEEDPGESDVLEVEVDGLSGGGGAEVGGVEREDTRVTDRDARERLRGGPFKVDTEYLVP
jgi:hypothetical protein